MLIFFPTFLSFSSAAKQIKIFKNFAIAKFLLIKNYGVIYVGVESELKIFLVKYSLKGPDSISA